jgi:hypothetical protein
MWVSDVVVPSVAALGAAPGCGVKCCAWRNVRDVALGVALDEVSDVNSGAVSDAALGSASGVAVDVAAGFASPGCGLGFVFGNAYKAPL